MTNPSLYLDRAAIHLNFSQHTEVRLQDVPNREYMLRLVVENVELRSDTGTTPVCP